MEKKQIILSNIQLTTIKHRLIQEIKLSNIKQCDLATAIGVNESMISEYLHTKKMPSLETFARICQVLELDANYILGIKEI